MSAKAEQTKSENQVLKEQVKEMESKVDPKILYGKIKLKHHKLAL